MSKYVAIAKITDPVEVQAKCSGNGQQSDKGAIFCIIPEIGLEGSNMVYCRYGLSIPYVRVQEDWKVLVEPTINEKDRWFYTGLVDCGGDVDPQTADQLVVPLAEGKMKISFGANIEIEADGTGNEITVTCSGNKIEMDSSSIDLTCGNSKVEMTTSSVKINDPNLEVLSG